MRFNTNALYTCLFLALFIIAFIPIPSALADQTGHDKTTIKGAFYPSNNPPYFWQNTDNSLHGLTHLIWLRLLEDLQFTGESQIRNFSDENQWNKLRHDISSGDTDMIVGVVKGQLTGIEAVMVSEPLLIVKTRIFVHKDDPRPYLALSDFNDKRGAISAPSDDFMKHMPAYIELSAAGTRFVNHSNKQTFVNTLVRRDVDIGIKSTMVMRALKRRYDKQDVIKELDLVLFEDTPVYLAISKASPLFGHIPRINELLKSYKNTGRYQFLIQQAMDDFIQQGDTLSKEVDEGALPQ